MKRIRKSLPVEIVLEDRKNMKENKFLDFIIREKKSGA